MLAVVTAISSFPLYFMLVMASRPNDDITSVPPPLWPGDQLWTNIERVLDNADVAFQTGAGQQLHRRGRLHGVGGAVLGPGRFRLREAALRGPPAAAGLRAG